MPETSNAPTLLLIGASRGLGLALAREHLARGWRVIATVRGTARTALHELSGDLLEIEQLEITDYDQIRSLRQRLSGRTVDLLFVNAGVSNDPGERIGDVTDEEFVRVMVTNALAPLRVMETLQDLVPPSGSIAVMSSLLGSVASNESGGYELYRASKAALNTLMRSFVARDKSDTRSFTIVHPGWVRTDMGGPNATLGVEESARGLADVLASRSGEGRLRYLDHKGGAIPW